MAKINVEYTVSNENCKYCQYFNAELIYCKLFNHYINYNIAKINYERCDECKQSEAKQIKIEQLKTEQKKT